MDGNHGETHPKTADFRSSGIPFIMASDLANGRIDTEHCAFLEEQHARSLRKGFALPGDVLLSHKATIGRTAMVPREIAHPFLMLTPQVTYYRVKDPTQLDPYFLKFYFESYEFQQLLLSWARQGSTRAYLGITDQLKLPIVVPPIEHQRRVATILQPLDDKIELNRRISATLEAMARALFKSWFVDFDPVRAKAKGHDTGLPKSFADLFPDSLEESELGEIPHGWSVTGFADTVEILSGGTPQTSVAEYWGGDIPWFSVVDAPREGEVFVVRTSKQITDKGLRNSAAQLVPARTTIISARGTVGRIALTGVPMTLNQSCYGLRGQDAAETGAYTYFTAQNLVATLRQQAHGSVFDTITRDTLASVAVVVPPKKLRRGFEAAVEPIMARLLSCIAETAKLKGIRDALLPKLISGKLCAARELAKR